MNSFIHLTHTAKTEGEKLNITNTTANHPKYEVQCIQYYAI